jgi:hypothetical protein
MTVERTPAERAEDELQSFREVIAGIEEEGEPLNIILSHRVREAVEMYLKGVAATMEETEGEAAIIGEMAISKGAETLPHATKGQLRGALSAYGTEQSYPTEGEPVENLAINEDS